MSKYSNVDELASLTVSQDAANVNVYDSSLLQSVPRNLDRTTLNIKDIDISRYVLSTSLFEGATNEERVQESLRNHLLKSRGLITNGPDRGSVEISYQGQKINREALLRYLVSFYEHNECHEQYDDRIFAEIICCHP
ncbi:hypothetical protein ACODM8_07130 [Vibrio ostreicida]|uniref:hypothetical protein n=1 Tax=Vibrio ostreicida TaxID=526588 RepID=UPI000970D70B